jgi:hypothetical protein
MNAKGKKVCKIGKYVSGLHTGVFLSTAVKSEFFLVISAIPQIDNSSINFQENPPNGLVADTRSQMDRWM